METNGKGRKESGVQQTEKKKLNKAKQNQILVQEKRGQSWQGQLPCLEKGLLHKYDSVFYFIIVLGSSFNLGLES